MWIGLSLYLDGGVAVEFADLKGFLPDTWWAAHLMQSVDPSQQKNSISHLFHHGSETYTKVMSFDAAEEGKLEILIESEYTIGNVSGVPRGCWAVVHLCNIYILYHIAMRNKKIR